MTDEGMEMEMGMAVDEERGRKTPAGGVGGGEEGWRSTSGTRRRRRVDGGPHV